MKLRLFHKIGEGGEESAVVRQFIVDHGLSEMIEFSNVTYEKTAQDLFELSGAREAPVLLVDGRPIRGRALILDWLKTNILTMRD